MLKHVLCVCCECVEAVANPGLYVLLIPTLPLLVLCRMGIIPLFQACRCEIVYADVLFFTLCILSVCLN